MGYPPEYAVIEGVAYGASNELRGTYHEPDAGEVVDTAVYGPDSGLFGELVLPDVSDVRDSVSFGNNGVLTGTFSPDYPDQDEVLVGVFFGPNSTTEGTVRLPTEAQVLNEVVFGPQDSLTGTLGGGTMRTELRERVGHYLFGIRTGFSADQTDDIDNCIDDGLKRVFAAHEWSFLRPLEDVTTTAPYTTGTIEIASGVVTLSDGTFPAWAASGVLQVNNQYYSVDSRDGDTQITLDSTALTVAAGASYQLGRPEIPLAATFDAVQNDSDLSYYPGAESWYPPVRQKNDSTIRRLEVSNPQFDRPVFYSVRTESFDSTYGSRKVLALYPTPDQEYTLRVPMVLRAFSIVGEDAAEIGAELLEPVVLEAALAAAEHNFEEREHVHEKRFVEMVNLAIVQDRDRSSATELGPDSARGERSSFNVDDYEYRLREQRMGGITLDGDSL